MESLLGHDFSQVRVHADASAADAAHELGAAAFTVGKHISFGADRYRPQTPPGAQLLAHELTHVVQNERPGAGPLPLLSTHGAVAEDEARGVFAALRRGDRPPALSRPPDAVIQRAPETWFRGEAIGVPPARPGAHLHDFGDGLYLTDSPAVAADYARTRAGAEVGAARRFSVPVEIDRLRVLDLTQDVRWQA